MVTITCDGCGSEQPNTQQDNFPDGGWDLPIDTFGYYGGFDDNISVLLGSEPSRSVVLCHDCVVKFLTVFPRIGEKMNGGCHPNFIHTDFRSEGDDGTIYPSCCRWAWTWVKKDNKYATYHGDGNGGWVLAYEDAE